MSSGVIPQDRFFDVPDAVNVRSHATKASPVWLVLKTLGSLKITVVMFALGILILFFGTLAQDEQNLAEVKRLYFNSWIAIVPVDVLFPITVFPHDARYPGVFPLPGGALIGLIMLVNLVAAKVTRFSVNAKGGRLLLGSVISLLGAGIVTMVIITGHASDGLQGEPPISYDELWGVMKIGVVLLTIGLGAVAITKTSFPPLARIALWVATAILAGTCLLLFVGGSSVRLDDPGLRIVWQLLHAGIASAVLLAGLWIVFGQRGGNVLIHVGVGLLMVGQFIFGDRQIEQRISLIEGQSSNMAFRQDELELALIDTSDPEQDSVTALSESMLRKAFSNKQLIDAEQLPCKLRILEWMPNSSVARAAPQEKNLATTGIGLQLVAQSKTTSGGAMEDVNIASAYVEILDKSSERSLGTILVSQHFNDQAQIYVGANNDENESIDIGGKPFQVALRFRREYKPYEVTLQDVRRINYSGSETPRDYSSDVVVTDSADGSKLEGHIWMNNPMRYKGQSFYQSTYNSVELPGKGPVEATGLQVVENAGWIIPYVCCMMVMLGMFAHFGIVFLRFSDRYARGSIATAADVLKEPKAGATRPHTIWDRPWVLGAIGLGLVAVMAIYYAKPPRAARDKMDWYAASKIPASHEGRIKPLDSVARNVLQVISEPVFGSVPTVLDSEQNKHSPTEWLLSLMADKKWPADSPIFRIYSQEARDFFDLKGRKGYRYTFSELEPKLDKLREELAPLRGKDSKTFTRQQQKLVEVHSKVNLYELVAISYRLPPLPDEAKLGTGEEAQAKFSSELMQILEFVQRIEEGHPPAIIPPEGNPDRKQGEEPKWQAYGPAIFAQYVSKLMSTGKNEPNPTLLGFTDIIDALRADKARDFNKAVSAYRAQLTKMPVAEKSLAKAGMEAWLNKFNPTAQGVVLYLLAMLLAFLSVALRWQTLRKVTFWILVGTLLVHTIALASRIYISGRPPVVNLYSSAVFIGWACVLGSLILERIFPIGICNLVAAITGLITISIARSLDTSDTMHVLQAVLDTQFWLSTHVVCITLGYAATFLAGFFGISALVHRVVTRYDALPTNKRSKPIEATQQLLYRLTYGIVCFAIFFSFVGTVLGGLWGDDSWGRFWGWDPKENGALIIVMWNALVIHARWDRFVGPRGFAALAVVGNIVTSWSWFGVNQLGIGLHSYGFTSGVLITLGISFIAHTLFVIGALAITSFHAQRGRTA